MCEILFFDLLHLKILKEYSLQLGYNVGSGWRSSPVAGLSQDCVWFPQDPPVSGCLLLP